MAETPTISHNLDQQGYAECADFASREEFIGLDELKARLAANNSDDEGDERNARTHIKEVGPKKKKQPKIKRPKPTGFEHYHADAPLTPAEHAQEEELYHRSIPFTTRILTAIQRFERRRKLNSEMRDIFLTYLKYGGVTNVSKDGNGGGDLKGIDTDNVIAEMVETSLTGDKDKIGKDPNVWAVDFQGVMKAFLSRRAPYCYGFETRAQVDTVTSVLSNFMNYILYHDVCPEYAADVLAARNICSTANAEMWACAEAQRWLPGDFNIACSTLFDGSYSRLYNGTTTWMPEESGLKGFVGMTGDVAREVVKFAIAGAASEEVYQAWYKMATEDTIEIVEVHQAAGFEIIAIDHVDDETKLFYREHTTEYRPVGKIRARPWISPDAPPEDLTVEEKKILQEETDSNNSDGSRSNNAKSAESVYEFFIEEVVLQHLFLGMKLEATVRKLNCGIWFFDEMLRAFCSFDTYLCNELMVGWKEPRTIDGAQAKLADEPDEIEEPEG